MGVRVKTVCLVCPGTHSARDIPKFLTFPKFPKVSKFLKVPNFPKVPKFPKLPQFPKVPQPGGPLETIAQKKKNRKRNPKAQKPK